MDQPAVTLDGQRVGLLAGNEQAIDAENVKDNRAEGVGLFRTEYLFINRAAPSEDKQYQSCTRRRVGASSDHDPHLGRGGGKFLSHLAVPTE